MSSKATTACTADRPLRRRVNFTGRPRPRVIAICLDGYEYSLARTMMDAGELPAMRALAARSARFLLSHGADLRTGLAGEHVATGLSASDAGRWAAVHFDAETYAVWQQGTSLLPFPARYDFRTVVFDPPYFDLANAPNVRGLVSWGAYDPGVPPHSRPLDLLEELSERFGPYPAQEWIYATPWSSVERSRRMGERLAAGVRLRARAARWLLAERLRDWQLALVTVSEAHSAIDGLWHGVDPDHPLHTVASSKAAGEGVRGVYRAVDELIAGLGAALPDATCVVFSMHGMGANGSDAASMFLLGELLYRHAFKISLHESGNFAVLPSGVPLLAESQTWRSAVHASFARPWAVRHNALARRLTQIFDPRRRLASPVSAPQRQHGGPAVLGLDWMPLTAYRDYWPDMPAFALPSFYDGRVRINLRGREAHGKVDVEDYRKTVAEIAALLQECVDPVSGGRVVNQIEYTHRANPLDVGETEADLVVVWDHAPLGLAHPRLGTIGPVPYRRTGGHTGEYGFAYFAGADIVAVDGGLASAYDVVPSIVDLLGGTTHELSGESLFHGSRYEVRALPSGALS